MRHNMTMTIDNEKFINFSSGKCAYEEVADVYIRFPIDLNLYEATDNEILELSERLGSYSFLNDASEDIYSISDGSPVE